MMVAVYGLLVLAVLLFLGIRFIRVLMKMRRPVLFPVTGDERKGIRIRPQKTIGLQTFADQKAAI